ncbi:MAG: aminoglycoside phosphotransferase family protein [Microlunatus sp.]|nr:aminoglycoside phosphotransferase family protein [Microlunatus sp.]
MPVRLAVDEPLVRRLVGAQFPQWQDLAIRRVENEGWDNRTFRLGETMSVRLPSAEPYALAVRKEQQWLPVLAPELPLPIPVPLAQGEPAADYPHTWSVYSWLPGRPAERPAVTGLNRFAAELAEFLLALQGVATTDGPRPGLHNWYRGGPLTRYQGEVDRALAVLDGRVGEGRIRELWQQALAAPWDRREVWFHGDIAVGNLLVRDGALAAVIDFGTCGVGDPACDLAIAWTFLEPDSRSVFLDTLGVDAATIARGRGWALWKALAGCAGAVRDGDDPDPGVLYTLDQLLPG